MSYSYTSSETRAFTVTHARHLAAKLATDLKRMQRFYGSPSDHVIANYEAEAIELLKHGYLGTAAYGYRRDGNWIEPTLRYRARDLAGTTADDDDPGGIRPGASTAGGSFYSYVTYSAAWDQLTESERRDFKKRLPFQRGGAPEPGISGYLSKDRTYSSGDRALDRATIRSYQ